MIWSIFITFLGFASLGNAASIKPETLDELMDAGEYEKAAEMLGVDVKFIRPDESEQRSEGSRFNHVSFLGDIMLKEGVEGRSALDFDKYPTMKWPNNKIPYVIGRGFSSQQRQKMNDDVSYFNELSPDLQLVPWSGEEDYVQVINGNGCWSYLGRVGGRQPLSLQRNGCLSTGTFHHEFMHAAGFTHEHNRLDRDEYVTVLWHNIPEDWHSQYEKVNDDYKNIGSYDYGSVMHYPIWSPETYEDAFLLLHDFDRNRLGQDEGLSETDAKKLSMMYGR